tara:strand:- start:67 stop:246 length:180 start_codon:yes stop_codon:yes gene_type:complete
MEMQFFILGHVILLAISWATATAMALTDEYGPFGTFFVGLFLMFISLEAVYWILHWIFV